jgi:TolB-like protein/DNA-binding winged helix-turn-helix (wHTH) protein/Tfp pilus assembly protein PilF
METGTLQPDAQRFRLDDLEVDLQWQTVRRGDAELELPDLSFRLLATLVRHAPKRVTKDELVREVWNGVVVSDETLAQRVRLLRQALGEDSQNPRYIASVRGHGYRLVCPARAINDAAPLRRATRIWAVLCGSMALALVVTWFAFTSQQQSSVDADTSVADSVAVLPFADLSADNANRHFADGMQEELLTRLTQLNGLDVVSRTSVEKFRSSELGLPEIAREVGADAIIEGSVRIADDRMRITVQLIDAATDRHLWAENFDRELTVENIFSVQEEVADRIARALQLEYPSSGTVQSIELPTTSLAAYDAFLLGRYHTFRQTPDNLEKAVTHLSNAVQIDAEFAEAYASLGWAYSFLGTNYGTLAPREAYPKAREAATRALALDSNLADARSLYADILTWYDWDFAAAEREYQKARELDPQNVLGYALFLSTQLRHEQAVALAELRLEYDTTDVYSWVNAAWRLLNAGQVERAIEAATNAEGHPDASSALGFSLIAAGEFDRAVDVFDTDINRQGRNPRQLSNLAYASFKAGRLSEGRALLEELETMTETAYVSPGLIAAVYFAAGDADTGFEILQLAVSERAREVIFLQVSQMLTGYRDDPRYAALVQSVGFL